MNLPITTQPLDAAVRRLRSKTPVGSRLRSRDWAEVPLALRERAQFSAGVESARVVQGIQDALMEWVTLGKDRPVGIPADAPRAFMDRSKFVKELRGLIGAPQGDTGDVKDITSRKRLELIYDFQAEDVYGFGRWKTDNDPEILAGFPAYEFMRVEDRRVPRDQVDPGHWQRRFFEAAKAAGDDRALAVQRATHRMVALKGSLLWARLSIFGRPWAPFDWGSGMGLVDVDRAEAESLGLLDPGEPVPPAEPEQFNAGLQASVRDLSPETVSVLSEAFGDRIVLRDGVVHWQWDNESSSNPPPPPESPLAPLVTRRTFKPWKTVSEARLGMPDAGIASVGESIGLFEHHFGTKISAARRALTHANDVAEVMHELRSRFPTMPLDAVKKLLLVSPRGGVLGLASLRESSVPSRMAIRYKAYHEQNASQWEQRRADRIAAGRPVWTVDDTFGGTVRHELGHALTMDRHVSRLLAAYRDKLSPNTVREWVQRTVSEYAATNAKETIAEAFCLYTSPDYTKGSLPQWLEEIVRDMLGEETET